VVIWITGRSGAGKTTLAKRIQKQTGGVLLDGDELRNLFCQKLFSEKAIKEHLLRMTQIGRLLESQGFTVIIACISPFRVYREMLQSMFIECLEIYLPGGTMWEGTTYEEPLGITTFDKAYDELWNIPSKRYKKFKNAVKEKIWETAQGEVLEEIHTYLKELPKNENN